ncbi:MAG: hypothetical protein V2A71_05340 [Candidatus Eisenbacteria bacterium]
MSYKHVRATEFWLSLRLALSALRRPELLLPFGLYAGVQLLVTAGIVLFHRPGISMIAEPIVRSVGGEESTHYPQFFASLPLIAERLFSVLHVLVGSIASGATVILASFLIAGRPPEIGRAFRSAGGMYGHLLAVVVLVELITLTLSSLIYRTASGAPGGLLAAPFVARGLSIAVILATQTVFAYLVPSVAVSGNSFRRAVSESIRIAARNVSTTFIVILLSFLPHLPLRYLISKSAFFALKLRPELTAWLIGADVLLGIFTGLFLACCVTRMYLLGAGED